MPFISFTYLYAQHPHATHHASDQSRQTPHQPVTSGQCGDSPHTARSGVSCDDSRDPTAHESQHATVHRDRHRGSRLSSTALWKTLSTGDTCRVEAHRGQTEHRPRSPQRPERRGSRAHVWLVWLVVACGSRRRALVPLPVVEIGGVAPPPCLCGHIDRTRQGFTRVTRHYKKVTKCMGMS